MKKKVVCFCNLALKKDIGIILCIVFFSIFIVVSSILKPCYDGAYWYVVSSIQRILFGIIELYIFVKIYKREKWTNVIHFKNFKYGFPASIGMFLYLPFEIITYYIIGAKEWLNTTVPIVLSCLLFQQFATGFWEELTFRGFVCEGYYQRNTPTAKNRFIYAFISLIIFGMIHAIECDTLEIAIYRFITTGIWGFAFASLYLYTHNILVSMCMHFFTDIFLNVPIFVAEWNDSIALTILDNYIQFVFLGIMFIVAVYFLLKEPKNFS